MKDNQNLSEMDNLYVRNLKNEPEVKLLKESSTEKLFPKENIFKKTTFSMQSFTNSPEIEKQYFLL
jgi:hypothetical protein